jgi:hypothetical protein
MAANDYNITPANWDGPHGTSWVTNNAAAGKPHITHAKFRSMMNRAQPQGPLSAPAGPMLTPVGRSDSFEQGMVSGIGRVQDRPSLGQELVRAGVGAAIGYGVYRAVQNRRAR